MRDPTPRVDSRYGAPLGRPDGAAISQADAAPRHVSLRRLPLDRGGYDRGGAYWGPGAPLYFAASDDGVIDTYFRAADRDSAKARIGA